MSAWALLIFYFLLALGVSFACSVFEAVLLSVRRTFVERMKEQGMRGAAAWEHLSRNRSRALAAILIHFLRLRTSGPLLPAWPWAMRRPSR